MTEIELIILNFEEIRRRSIKLWNGLSPEMYLWRPDQRAMSCLEMVRHVLEGEHLFHKIVESRGNIGHYESPWQDKLYTNLEDELQFATPFRKLFFDAVRCFDSYDLSSIEIIRSEKGQRRKLGDYLQRVAYHEAVHAGQMLSYFRIYGIDRPSIWD
jgi:uncharacterized damage-inducible protein DinB